MRSPGAGDIVGTTISISFRTALQSATSARIAMPQTETPSSIGLQPEYGFGGIISKGETIRLRPKVSQLGQ
jgi:hypothetical protein